MRSSGIHPEDERHTHVIKDFISALQKNVRNKIVNKWTELRNPPRTVQEAFYLATRIKTQIQVVDSFKVEQTNDFISVDINEISADEMSGDEFEVNEVSRGKKRGNKNNYRKIITIIEISAVSPDTVAKQRQQEIGTKGERLKDCYATSIFMFHSHKIWQVIFQIV